MTVSKRNLYDFCRDLYWKKTEHGEEYTELHLKKIIIALFDENQGHLQRKLIIQSMQGNYKDSSVIFSMQGSPPRGQIFVIDANYTRPHIFFYNTLSMKRLDKFRKYDGLVEIFHCFSKKFLKDQESKKNEQVKIS